MQCGRLATCRSASAQRRCSSECRWCLARGAPARAAAPASGGAGLSVTACSPAARAQKLPKGSSTTSVACSNVSHVYGAPPACPAAPSPSAMDGVSASAVEAITLPLCCATHAPHSRRSSSGAGPLSCCTNSAPVCGHREPVRPWPVFDLMQRRQIRSSYSGHKLRHPDSRRTEPAACSAPERPAFPLLSPLEATVEPAGGRAARLSPRCAGPLGRCTRGRRAQSAAVRPRSAAAPPPPRAQAAASCRVAPRRAAAP